MNDIILYSLVIVLIIMTNLDHQHIDKLARYCKQLDYQISVLTELQIKGN